MRVKYVVAMGALVTALAGARGAAAQTPSERLAARQLMDDGDRYAEQKKFAEALRVYTAAHAIMHVPTTGLEVARTQAALGRLVEARETALAVARMPVETNEPKPFGAARREAADLVDELDERIPILRLELTGGADPSTLRVSIDDTELSSKVLSQPQRVNPGRRRVRVRAAGYEPVLREVDAYEGSTATVVVDLGQAPATPFGLSPLALGGLGAAAAGVTVGTITGIISLDKASDARTLCGPDPKSCDPAAASTIDASKTYGWIATASFAIAVAGGALATYSILSKKDATSSAASGGATRVDVVVTAGGGGLRGTF